MDAPQDVGLVLQNDSYSDNANNDSDSFYKSASETNAPNNNNKLDIVFYPAPQAVLYIQYGTIFVLGILGNCLVCFVVFRNRHMQTVTNYFIANLALADILLCTLALPFTPAYFFMGEWVFGEFLCRLLSWSQGVSVYVSTLTLTSIAVDRYFVILYPFGARLRLRACYLVVLCIWAFSLAATVPYALYMRQVRYDAYEGQHFCEERWTSQTAKQIFSLFTTVLQFVIPFTVILFCYVKISAKMSQRMKAKPGAQTSKKDEADRDRKRRTNRMLIAMVSVFGVSWLPLNVYNLLNDYYGPTAQWEYINLAFFVTHVVAMSSTCYNPFLYAWLNENFRKEFQVVLPCYARDRFDRGRGTGRRRRSERTCGGGGGAFRSSRTCGRDCAFETQMETMPRGTDNDDAAPPDVRRDGRRRVAAQIAAPQPPPLPRCAPISPDDQNKEEERDPMVRESDVAKESEVSLHTFSTTENERTELNSDELNSWKQEDSLL